jgi:hypothetical protein
VNHADSGKYKRGQGFFSFSDIQNDLCWYAGYRKMVYSKPQITKSLRKLNERNMTATTKATRGLIITIRNYNEYQDPKNYEGNDEVQAKEQRRKSSGHTKNKNVKNERIEEEPKDKQIAFGSHVRLTQDQIDSLKQTMNGSFEHYVEAVNDYCAAKGKRYKDYAAAIRNFYRRDNKNKPQEKLAKLL